MIRESIGTILCFAVALVSFSNANADEKIVLEVIESTIEAPGVEKQCRGTFVVKNVGPTFKEVPPTLVGPWYTVYIYDAQGKLLFQNVGGWGSGMKADETNSLSWSTRSNHLGETSEPPFLIPAPGRYRLEIVLSMGRKAELVVGASSKWFEVPAPPPGEPPNVKLEKGVAAFLTQLESRIPEGWKLHDPNRGAVRPYGWEKGRGCHILVFHEKAPVVAGKRAPWTDLHLWIMDEDYRPKIPLVHELSRPATEIDTWHGRRVFFQGDGEHWPTNKSDVLAALGVSDSSVLRPSISTEQLRKSLAAARDELRRRETGEGPAWQISTDLLRKQVEEFERMLRAREAEESSRAPSDTRSPGNLPAADPHCGLNHRVAAFLIAGNGKDHVTMVGEDGQVICTRKVKGMSYCAIMLENGNMLVSDYSIGEIKEITPSGTTMWVTEGIPLKGSVHGVSRLANGNTLIAHTDGSRVIEVNRRGKIVWEYPHEGMPASAQRLPNGNTLIALWSGGKVIEVTHSGNVVWQKEGLSVPHDAVRLRNRNVLIADFGNKRVIEVDRQGRVVWSRQCGGGPASAARLPDGRTLISDWSEGVVLVDREGQVIQTLLKQHNPGKASIVMTPSPDERCLKRQYDAFVEALDNRRIAKDYPKAVEKLDSPDQQTRISVIETLAATGEVEVIPWIVPFVDSKDKSVRIRAGLSLSNIVAGHQLKRRDMSQPERVVIKPLGSDDLDLKPMAWVILNMLRKPDDGNTHSYAANMIGYLKIEQFEGNLRQLLWSRHPAVTRAAENALQMLGTQRGRTPRAVVTSHKLTTLPERKTVRADFQARRKQ